MSLTRDLAPIEDPDDRRLAQAASGLLREFNLADVLTAADVHVAMRLGRLGQESDESVLLAAALAVRAARTGSVCLDLTGTRTGGIGGVDRVAPDLPWPESATWLAAVEASDLTGDGGALRLEDGLLYLDRYWHEEQQVCADLDVRRTATPPTPSPDRLAGALDAYFPDRAFADQRAAAESAARHWTSVITGGPGTGKTTTIARLIGVLASISDEPLRVALAAPTGKAATRMAQAVRAATQTEGFPVEHQAMVGGLQATTMHRLLGFRPDNRTRFRHHRGNRLSADVVVIDETSMVSLTMMARLVEAVRPDARLVLVGDSDQLASVEAGAVLKDLVEGLSGNDSPVTRLGPTRRYGARIAGLAEAIRAGDPDAVMHELTAGHREVSLVPRDALEDLLLGPALRLLRACEAGDRALAMRELDAHRLLCAHREGPFGVGHWNRRVERMLMSSTGREWLPNWYAGQPLIVNANDYGLALFNGDTGVVCADADGARGLVGLVADGDLPEGRPYPLTRLADVTTAHAITVHRSQGSQFDEVTVLLPEADSPLSTRELFYTAVTRARSSVRVVATEDAVRAAVVRPAQRATGLAARLS